MTERVDFGDFVIAHRRIIESRSAAGPKELRVWLADSALAFGRIPYLRVGKVHLGDDEEFLIEIHASLKLKPGALEYARLDLERVFNEDLANSSRGSHAFKTTESCLSFFFCCVTPANEYVSGRLRAMLV